MSDVTATPVAAEVTQLGDIFQATFNLPLKVNGERMRVTVRGVGALVVAEIAPAIVDLQRQAQPVRDVLRDFYCLEITDELLGDIGRAVQTHAGVECVVASAQSGCISVACEGFTIDVCPPGVVSTRMTGSGPYFHGSAAEGDVL